MIKIVVRRQYRIVRYVMYRQTLVEPADHFWTFVGAFVAIAAVGLLGQGHLTPPDNVFLIGSFGASCVLIFWATHSPLAQPRNLVGGHLLASVIGVSIYKLLPDQLWLSAALSVSLAIVGMQVTKTMHPPAGATALIANIGSDKIKALGFQYVLTPVLTGVLILLVVALIINNIPPNRSYPSQPVRLTKRVGRWRKSLKRLRNQVASRKRKRVTE
jgi:CBS domain-containing membrane protein